MLVQPKELRIRRPRAHVPGTITEWSCRQSLASDVYIANKKTERNASEPGAVSNALSRDYIIRAGARERLAVHTHTCSTHTAMAPIVVPQIAPIIALVCCVFT